MLSFNIIVKNEAHCIADCLNSIKSIADEIIIVDTGSTDKTIEICRQFTAKIFHFKWIDDFSAARNFAKQKSTGDWIFIIDADEVLNSEEHGRILNALNNNNKEAYICETKNFDNKANAVNFKINSTNAEIRLSQGAAGWFPSLKIRLFRNKPAYKFYGRIHEMLDESSLNNKISIADFFIYHYGYLFFNEKNKDTKLEFYEKLNELKYIEQKDIKSAYELAKQKRIMRKFSEAEKLYLECIDKNYRCADAYNDLTALYIEIDDKDKAIDCAEKSLKIDADNISALNNYASVLYKLKEYEKARDILKKIIDIKPDHSNAYYNIAVIYDEIDDFDNAVENYNKAVSLNSNDINSLANLILLFFNRRNFFEAKKYMDKLCFICSEHNIIKKYKKIIDEQFFKLSAAEDMRLFELAKEQFNNNDFKNALKNFRKSLHLNNKRIEAHKHIAECYKNLGDNFKYELEMKRYNNNC